MRINGARVEGGELILSVPISEARKLAYKFKPGEYELKQVRKKRSLDANGMAWALIHQIAAEVKISPEEVYREAVRSIGGVSEVIMIKREAVEQFKEAFCKEHIGRHVNVMPNANREYMTLIVSYGSSDYDTRQMGALIDALIEDARSLGIETPEDSRINSLLDEWEARHEKKD